MDNRFATLTYLANGAGYELHQVHTGYSIHRIGEPLHHFESLTSLEKYMRKVGIVVPRNTTGGRASK
jgi:hypothetical protein